MIDRNQAYWHNHTAKQQSAPDAPTLEPVPRVALTRQEAAEALGLSVDVVDNLIASGRLLAIRPVPRRVLLPVAELHAFIERETQGAINA